MLKVAILDDYQNVSQQFVDLEKLSGKYEFKIFSQPFIDENNAIEQLADYEALLIMRERTPITKIITGEITLTITKTRTRTRIWTVSRLINGSGV